MPKTVTPSLSARRAWIEIIHTAPKGSDNTGSLSARRAWIEILMKCQVKKYSGSLSARRAWIEILLMFWLFRLSRVALRKESVDRNAGVLPHYSREISRSPQGERG